MDTMWLIMVGMCLVCLASYLYKRYMVIDNINNIKCVDDVCSPEKINTDTNADDVMVESVNNDSKTVVETQL